MQNNLNNTGNFDRRIQPLHQLAKQKTHKRQLKETSKEPNFQQEKKWSHHSKTNAAVFFKKGQAITGTKEVTLPQTSKGTNRREDVGLPRGGRESPEKKKVGAVSRDKWRRQRWLQSSSLPFSSAPSNLTNNFIPFFFQNAKWGPQMEVSFNGSHAGAISGATRRAGGCGRRPSTSISGSHAGRGTLR